MTAMFEGNVVQVCELVGAGGCWFRGKCIMITQ
jgi:hypothetical protein